jgi:hypothetical protein
METTWVCHWFQRLLKHVTGMPKGEHKVRALVQAQPK